MGRVTIHKEQDKLEIIIPTRKNPFLIIFSTVWLLGFGIGGAKFLYDSAQTFPLRPVNFNLSQGWFLGILGVACIFLIYYAIQRFSSSWPTTMKRNIAEYLWLISGKEIITVTPDQLSVVRKRLFHQERKEYPIAEVKNLRVWLATAREVSRGEVIKERFLFDYHDEETKFGLDLTKDEALNLLQEMEGFIKNNYLMPQSNLIDTGALSP